MSLVYPLSRRSSLKVLCRSNSVKRHVQTTRGLFPHKRITRKSEMTSKGLIVTEELEDITGLPESSNSPSSPLASPTAAEVDQTRRSPIAELLYMRWLEGLKLKWPSIMS